MFNHSRLASALLKQLKQNRSLNYLIYSALVSTSVLAASFGTSRATASDTLLPSSESTPFQRVCSVEQTDLVGNTLQYEVVLDFGRKDEVLPARLTLRSRKPNETLFNTVFAEAPLRLYSAFFSAAYKFDFVKDLDFSYSFYSDLPTEISHKYTTVTDSRTIPNKTDVTEVDFKGIMTCVTR